MAMPAAAPFPKMYWACTEFAIIKPPATAKAVMSHFVFSFISVFVSFGLANS